MRRSSPLQSSHSQGKRTVLLRLPWTATAHVASIVIIDVNESRWNAFPERRTAKIVVNRAQYLTSHPRHFSPSIYSLRQDHPACINLSSNTDKKTNIMTKFNEEKKEEGTPASVLPKATVDKEEKNTVETEVHDDEELVARSIPSKEAPSMVDAKVGDCVAKHFLFYGTITGIWKDKKGNKMWRVLYEDSDEEDLNVEEMTAAVALYKKKKEGNQFNSRAKKTVNRTKRNIPKPYKQGTRCSERMKKSKAAEFGFY
jgi:hypothetical protein